MAGTNVTDNRSANLSAKSTITQKFEWLSSTNGFLNVNATVSIGGAAIPIVAATTAIVTAIVDGSGNQITTFGGGTQYATGTSQATPTGTVALGYDGTAVRALSTTSSGTLMTTEVAPSTIFNGKTSVTTAGTRVVLASSQTVKSVTVKALAANTGTIYVGNSGVASSNGFQLAAGDSISLDVADLNTVNIDSSVNGEGVSYLGVN